jgi:hypothetical protein
VPSVRNFATWMPLLAVMWAIDPDGLASPGTYVAGHVDARGGWGYMSSADLHQRLANVVPALAARTGIDPIGLVQDALKEAAIARISFVVNFFRGGRVVLHLLDFGHAVEVTAGGIGLGSLVLVEGALPELWRRQPTSAPHARPAASADPQLLERTLRERLPGATGATETEIATAEAHLGISFPEELKALYRVTRARREDGHEAAERVFAAAAAIPWRWTTCTSPRRPLARSRGYTRRRKRPTPRPAARCRPSSARPAGSSSVATALATGWRST